MSNQSEFCGCFALWIPCFGVLCPMSVQNIRTYTVVLQYHPVANCVWTITPCQYCSWTVPHMRLLLKRKKRVAVKHSQPRDWGRAWESLRERSREGERWWAAAVVTWIVDHRRSWVAADTVTTLLPSNASVASDHCYGWNCCAMQACGSSFGERYTSYSEIPSFI